MQMRFFHSLKTTVWGKLLPILAPPAAAGPQQILPE